MNHPQHGCSSHPAPAAQPPGVGVASSLLLAAALPAMASESLDAWQQQRQLQAAWAQPRRWRARRPAPTQRPQHPRQQPAARRSGNAGDPASWHTEEFNADWGLAATHADDAYARGLTGTGIRLGVFDSGTGLDHPNSLARTIAASTSPTCSPMARAAPTLHSSLAPAPASQVTATTCRSATSGSTQTSRRTSAI